MNAQQRLDRSTKAIIMKHPWWASLLLRLDRQISDRVPTAATDGTRLLINEKYIATLNDAELEGLLLHETAHCALLHCFRCGPRDPFIWNVYADQIVNAILVAEGITLPPHGVSPASTMDDTVEDLYNKNPLNAKTITLSLQDLIGGLGDKADGDQPQEGDGTWIGSPQRSDEQQQQSKAGSAGDMSASDWKTAVAQAGTMPAHIYRAWQTMEAAEHPWYEELAPWLTQVIKSPLQTWNDVSRRMGWGWPGRKKIKRGEVGICVDTSGSISGPVFSGFMGHVTTITALENLDVVIVFSDAAVSEIVEPGQSIPEIHGGGGTDFRPAIDLCVERNVDAIIYLTDGEGSYPDHAPATPIIWAMITSCEPPFGKVVRVRV